MITVLCAPRGRRRDGAGSAAARGPRYRITGQDGIRRFHGEMRERLPYEVRGRLMK